ncbi:MAG: hypothetical protein AB2L11_06995 [Syntrophobacteraceae bacterium]
MSKGFLRNVVLSSIMLWISACLIWYCFCTNRLFAKDLSFIKKHASTDFFSDSWLLRGRVAYYVDLDSVSAVECFRRAIVRQPLSIDAWLALAKAEIVRDRVEEAENILSVMAPLISHVSTWKWQELLLAFDKRDENYFAACFNYILARLPHRIREANYLALAFWNDWAGILPHVGPESRTAFLNELMKAKKADVALDLWSTMAKSSTLPNKADTLQFCNFLLGNGRVGPAKEIWKSWKGNPQLGIYDGGFEQQPLNSAFGWRFKKHPEVNAERVLENPFSGSYCLELHFRGTKNVAFSHVTQIVPVEPGRTYNLKFAKKSHNLTSDQGVFLGVSGYGCKGLSLQSEAVTGTTPWTEERLKFEIPDDCEAVQVQVKRKESLKFDSKISGDYWLDALELEPAER